MVIRDIIAKIDENQLFVPAFQREYVWKRNDAKNLVASLIKEYPTGTMLTWETSNPPELKGPHQYNEQQGSIKLILDGQQRITTLYMLIKGKVPPYYTKKEITNDIRGLYVHIENLQLEYYKKTVMENDPLWVNITDIFQEKIFYRDIVYQLEAQQDGERLTREHERQIEDNFQAIKKVTTQEFKELTIPTKATIKEAIDIFYIVNASGVNLSDAELALAQISGYWPNARVRIKKKLFELQEEGWVFKLDFFVYVLLGCVHHVGSKMEKLHTPDNLEAVKATWEQLETDTLDYVFNLMKSQAFIDHTKEINSVYALAPIIVYAFRKGKDRLNDQEIRKAIKWFYYSQLRQRYISQLPQKLDKDIGIIVKETNPFDKLLKIIEEERRLEIAPTEFIGVGVSHPLWSLMKWYFKSRQAVCFSTGVGIRKNMGKKYSLEWDHIFAYSILKEAGYGWEDRHKYALAQEITNRAVITQVGNRSKSARLAEVYLQEVRDRFPNALKLQVIPEDEELWKLENFEGFLAARRKLLADQLNQFLSQITETADEKLTLDVAELISQGENHGLELKTTLRWDVREQKVNKALEEVILKTIAAFSNGEGGILLIGVTDDGDIAGLDDDYNTLKNGSKDSFEVHLKNLINQAYGTEFGVSNIKVTFPQVEEKEICMVEIKAGIKPVYTTVTDRNGARSQKFYVRSGNSSQEIGLMEISDYVKRRFENGG